MQDKDPFLNLLTVFIQRNSIMSYSDYNSLFSLKRKIQSLPTGTCIPFSKKIFITVNGKLLPCERIGQEYSLGHVTDQKVELDLNAICKYYNKWLMPISQKCSTCYMRHSCQHCIFNFPKSDKPFCIDYLNKENFKTEILDSTEPILVDFFATWCGPCRLPKHRSYRYQERRR